VPDDGRSFRGAWREMTGGRFGPAGRFVGMKAAGGLPLGRCRGALGVNCGRARGGRPPGGGAAVDGWRAGDGKCPHFFVKRPGRAFRTCLPPDWGRKGFRF
jgi:hypothetical protein